MKNIDMAMSNYKVVIGLFYDTAGNPIDIMAHGVVMNGREWKETIFNEILRLCKKFGEFDCGKDISVSLGNGEYGEKVWVFKYETGMEHVYLVDVTRPEEKQ